MHDVAIQTDDFSYTVDLLDNSVDSEAELKMVDEAKNNVDNLLKLIRSVERYEKTSSPTLLIWLNMKCGNYIIFNMFYCIIF